MTVTSWQTFNAKMEEVKSAVLAWGKTLKQVLTAENRSFLSVRLALAKHI